jgi:hypothetical protein
VIEVGSLLLALCSRRDLRQDGILDREPGVMAPIVRHPVLPPTSPPGGSGPRFTQHRSNSTPFYNLSPPSLSRFPSPLIAIIVHNMILGSALVAGLLAWQASAFLVPLEVVKEVEAAKAQLEALWTNHVDTIDLSCPGCTFAGPQQDGVEYSESDENTIVSVNQSYLNRPSSP